VYIKSSLIETSVSLQDDFGTRLISFLYLGGGVTFAFNFGSFRSGTRRSFAQKCEEKDYYYCVFKFSSILVVVYSFITI